MLNNINKSFIIPFLHVLSKNAIILDYLINFSLIVRVNSIKYLGIYFEVIFLLKVNHKRLKISRTTVINLNFKVLGFINKNTY